MRLLAFCQSSFTTALQLHQPRTRNVIVAKLAGIKKVVNPDNTQYILFAFPCSIFNNSSQFRGTQRRIFSYFIRNIPFFSSTEYSSLWFPRLILYGSSIFKLNNCTVECVLLTICPVLGRQ